MKDCKEFELDDVLAVTAIPVADYSLPLSEVLQPVIHSNLFHPLLTHAIVVGRSLAVTGGKLIPIIQQTGKCKDSSEDSVAGRLHTVDVTCDIDCRISSVWSNLLSLERTPSHLLLTFRGGRRAFVNGSIDTYMCRYERDGSRTTVVFKVEALMGVQMID